MDNWIPILTSNIYFALSVLTQQFVEKYNVYELQSYDINPLNSFFFWGGGGWDGIECLGNGNSLAYVAHFVFLREGWIRT
jgi:hypothetical protein